MIDPKLSARHLTAFSVALLALLVAACGPISFRDDIGPLPQDDGDTTPAPPASLMLLPSTVSVQVSDSVVFTASGGVRPYRFTDEAGRDLAPNADEVTVTYQAPATAGTYIVTVTDAQELVSEATVMATARAPLSVNPSAVMIGEGATVTLTASGGTPPYAFSQTTPGDPGTLAPSGPTAVYTALGVGVFTISLTDSAPATVTAEITVAASGVPPGGLLITPMSVAIQTNQGITFAASGGSGGYQYSVISGSGTIDPLTGAYTAPAAAGTDTVRVTDSGGHTSDATVNVYFPLTIIPASVSVTQGSSYAFSATGGKPPYVYTIASGGGSVDPSTGLYTAPGSPGTDSVKVADALNNASYATVTVIAPPPAWSVQSIDTALRSGQYASLALDPVSGDPRIAYYESQTKSLRLVKWNGSTWTTEVVDESATNVGAHCSLALDLATGNPRISYYQGAPAKDLWAASWTGSSWAISPVDQTGDVGQYSSLALDGAGNPRISYYDATGRNLKYASWTGSSWTITPIDETGDVGQYSSLTFDSAGNPRIAYYDGTNRDLKYAAWTGSSWEVVAVDQIGDVGQYSSLALDSAGNPRIAYYDSTNGDLKYAWFDGSAWHAEIADGTPSQDRGMYASLALDGDGHPRISYYDNTAQFLIFAAYNGSSWSIETVDAGPNVGKYTSLGIDGSGHAHIAYYDAGAQDLKYAWQP